MRTNKIYLIAAICLVVGLSFFIIGFAALGFDFTKLGAESQYEEKSYSSASAIKALIIDDDNISITMSVSADNQFHITYFENDQHFYDISESSDETLSVIKKNSLKWIDYLFNISFGNPKLAVEIPLNFEGDVSVKTENGKVFIESIKAGNLTVNTSNQTISIQNVTVSKKLDVKTCNGDIAMNAVSTSADINCKTNNGPITLENISGESLSMESDNGKLCLDLVTIKNNIYAKTQNMSIILDHVLFGTEITCITSNGNIAGEIVGKLGDFSFDCKTSNGKCNLPENIKGGDKIITMKTSNGAIDIAFSD